MTAGSFSDASGATYNAWQLAFLAPWPRWAVAIFVLAAIASVFAAWWSLRAEARRARRIVLVCIRAVTAILALFVLMEPAVRLLQTARVKNRLAVLVDGSRSMSFPSEPGGPPRAEAAARFLRDHKEELERLGDRVSLEWHVFDRDVTPVDPSTLTRPVAAKGGRTDLLGALKTVSASGGAGRKLAAAIVLSDGADNAALADGLPPPARAELRALGVPVTAISVGTSSPKDLAIERVAIDNFAFVRNTVTAEVGIAARGMGREEIPIVLRREGAVVASASVKLEPGKERYTVPLAFAPDTTGTFVFTVAAPVFAGEALSENNTRSFILRVIRDRVRVLLVAGRPSWDERFLRALLKHDPNIDLISFFILRSSTDLPGAQEELSLIPFPVAEIFGEQLRTFDAVIFANFAFQPYRSLDIERFLPGIRDYVKNGGAFAMLGGEQSFGEGKYAETPLGEILPLQAASGLGVATEPIRPRLTPEGRRHPVSNLAPGEAPNEAAWSGLPPLPELNRTRALPPETGSRVLLEAPTVLVDGRPAPVVAVREVGSGRSLAVATGSSWYWGFVAAEQEGSIRNYQRFWNNALRWLVRDPALTPVQIEPDRPAVEPGEPVGLSISVRGSDYGPGAGTPVTAELLSEDGRVAARGETIAGPDGTARLELMPPGPGAYKAVATSRPGCPKPPCPTKGAQATGAVAVRAAGPEDVDAAPRPELLRGLAQATGGAFATIEHGLPRVPLTDPDVVEVGGRKDLPIWDRPVWLAALVLALAGEWVLRRRWGFW